MVTTTPDTIGNNRSHTPTHLWDLGDGRQAGVLVSCRSDTSRRSYCSSSSSSASSSGSRDASVPKGFWMTPLPG
jgi:hypothetical protein